MQANNTAPTTTHGAEQPNIKQVNDTGGDSNEHVRRQTMNGKPVFEIPAKTVINFKSGFIHKKLCDGPTFSTGSSCAYTCPYCFTGAIMRKQKPYYQRLGILVRHEDAVIRRNGAIAQLRRELTDTKGRPKFQGAAEEGRVIYASQLVDIAANMELCRETVEACKLILEFTPWTIRLLSKSNLLPWIARSLGEGARERVIYGVSTGTLDDELARVVEKGTPLVSKRLESLHLLQDEGYRTFGMICPSLPQRNYEVFAEEIAKAIRPEKCEHVWAEVINVRGESMTRTLDALNGGGFSKEARMLEEVSSDKAVWEEYARATFVAHMPHYSAMKLRFLQYVTQRSRSWWSQYQDRGAVLL